MAPLTYRNKHELFEEAFDDVCIDTGTWYPCTQYSLDVTGGLNRGAGAMPFSALRNLWFDHGNPGPFISPRAAAQEIHDHNRLSRTPSNAERRALGRLDAALDNAHGDHWGPDLIIKAFCDLDTVFFNGRLRGHVSIAWRSASEMVQSLYGGTNYLSQGKCQIGLNADGIILDQNSSTAFRQMWSTMLHEMCHAYGQVRVRGEEWMEDERNHGKYFGAKVFAVARRAQQLLDLWVNTNDSNSGIPFPRHVFT